MKGMETSVWNRDDDDGEDYCQERITTRPTIITSTLLAVVCFPWSWLYSSLISSSNSSHRRTYLYRQQKWMRMEDVIFIAWCMEKAGHKM